MSTTASRRRPRRRSGLLGVVAVVLLAGGVAACGPTPAPSPTPSGTPAAVADLAPLAPDGRIDEADLAHDSRSDLYRTPFGAVPAGTEVTLRLRATAGDLTEATVRVWDELEKSSRRSSRWRSSPATGPPGEHGYDFWQATIRTSAKPTVLWYRFIAPRRADDAIPRGRPARRRRRRFRRAPTAGAGGSTRRASTAPGRSTVYEPDFRRPPGRPARSSTRSSRTASSTATRATTRRPDAEPGRPTGAARFRYGDVYGNPILVKAWDDLPEGYCRAYQGVACDEGPLGRDFFGGDLAGITAKLDDLADLGVTVIYLNPIFAAPSNHRYDTSSYDVVDPDLGTEADFARLIAEAKARGIRVILDGVFNHVSSDSPWFDRERRFEEDGRLRVGRLGLPRLVHVPRARPRTSQRPARPSTGRRRHLLRRAGSASTRSPSSSSRPRRLRPLRRRRRRRRGAGSRPGRPAGGSTSWTT